MLGLHLVSLVVAMASDAVPTSIPSCLFHVQVPTIGKNPCPIGLDIRLLRLPAERIILIGWQRVLSNEVLILGACFFIFMV